MTKLAQGLTIAALVGAGSGAGAQSQPGYPPAPVQPETQPPPAQPGYPPPSSPDDPPPQYPPQPAPGYPPEAGAPPYAAPPGYPQQPYATPPGYPQQPYPGPSEYPQQPYGQPGYPPPGYYPPESYAPPPPPPPTRPHGHGGLLLLPYFGLHGHEGMTGQNQDAGLRLGSFLGYRVNGQFSLNAELTIDVLNIVNQPAGVKLSGAEFDLAFSPLFHFDVGALELVAGPKLGAWGGVIDSKDDFGTTETSASGVVVGANLGAFFPLGNGASLGGLVSFVVRTVSNTCVKDVAGNETCMDTPHADSEKVLGVTAAVLF